MEQLEAVALKSTATRLTGGWQTKFADIHLGSGIDAPLQRPLLLFT
jgi:hypothetical protein